MSITTVLLFTIHHISKSVKLKAAYSIWILKTSFLILLFSDISVALRKTILTISDSIETGPPVESEIVRVVSLSTTEITEITRFRRKIIFRAVYLKCSIRKNPQWKL